MHLEFLSALSFAPMVNNPVRRLPGITASSCSKRFKVALLKPFVTLEILSFDIHTP